MEFVEWFSPSLTTIHTEIRKQGKYAVQKLLKMINDEESGSIVKLASRIVERESVKK